MPNVPIIYVVPVLAVVLTLKITALIGAFVEAVAVWVLFTVQFQTILFLKSLATPHAQQPLVSVVIFKMLPSLISSFEGELTIPAVDGHEMAGVLRNPLLDISHSNLIIGSAKPCSD